MIYRLLFRTFIFPIAELVSKTTILQKLRFLRKMQKKSRAELEEYQLEKLRKLLEHAYNTTTYYKNIFDKKKINPKDITKISDLSKIPILDKQIVRDNFDYLKSKSYKGKPFLKFTSGSTGTPTPFLRSKEDYSWEWAGHYRAWEWAGYKLGDKYVKISLNNDRNLWKKRLQDNLMRCRYIYAYNMKEEDIKKYVADILWYKPKFIYGYSSSLNIIATYMNSHNIKYKAKAIITTGDNLLPAFRQNIQQAFSAKVFDGYGCGGEGLNVAEECEEGNLHLNEDLIIVEVLNGEIIVTNLNNFAMPLIRYKPGDLVTLGKECKCEKPTRTLASVDGRSQDVIKTRNGSTLVVHFFTVLFEYIEGINQFKVIQDNLDNITIKIVKNEKYNRKIDEGKIRKFIEKSAGSELKIKFAYVNKIPAEKNGKMRFIESNLK